MNTNPTITNAPTEAEFQTQVLELARMLGWHHLHVRRSIGKGRQWVTATNLVGWPDLTLWSERQRRIVFAELKSEAGKVTAEQTALLGSLSAAGQECHIWRPSDFDELQRVLTGERATT